MYSFDNFSCALGSISSVIGSISSVLPLSVSRGRHGKLVDNDLGASSRPIHLSCKFAENYCTDPTNSQTQVNWTQTLHGRNYNDLMEVLLTKCKRCGPSPGRLLLRTYLRDLQCLPKESNKTPPLISQAHGFAEPLTGPWLVVERLRTSDLCSWREGATEIGPGFPGEGTIP